MITFSDFIAPFDVHEFKTQYYGRKPLHIRAQGHGIANPLPWKRFNEVLEIGPFWNEDMLKVFFKSRHALRENYCDLTNVADGQKALADPRKVKALLGLGASLVANKVHKVCPEVAAVASMLQREFGASVGANVYCSFKSVQAFSTHFDLHDVFAVQSEGEKTWHVYEARADNPVQPVPPGDEAEQWLINSRGRLLFEAVMKPGDIMYLPRGQYHDAVTGAEASLHVTYSVSPPTGLSLFKLLEAAAQGESPFRAYLPDANDTAALKQHLQRLARGIEQMMASRSFEFDVLNHQRGLGHSSAGFELPQRRQPKFYSITKRGHVARRPDGYVAIIDRVELPVGATGPAVVWLFGQRLFSVEDLIARHSFVDEKELHAVLAQLVKVGAIVETEMR